MYSMDISNTYFQTVFYSIDYSVRHNNNNIMIIVEHAITIYYVKAYGSHNVKNMFTVICRGGKGS